MRRALRNARIALARCNALEEEWKHQKHLAREAFHAFEKSLELHFKPIHSQEEVDEDADTIKNAAINWYRAHDREKQLHVDYRQAVVDHPCYCNRCQCIHGIGGDHDIVYHMKYLNEPGDPPRSAAIQAEIDIANLKREKGLNR